MIKYQYRVKLSRILKVVAVSLTIMACLACRTRSDSNEFRESEAEDFFEAWHSESSPITPKELSEASAVVQAAHGLFMAFYDPNNWDQYLGDGKTAWEFKPSPSSKYVVISESLTIRVVQDLDNFNEEVFGDEQYSDKLKLSDFRPRLLELGRIVLYASPERITALSDYLGVQFVDFKKPDIKYERNMDDLRRRVEVLSSFIQVLPGHWGPEDWHILTHPQVSSIILNQELSEGIVLFRIGWGGGKARLSRFSQGWRMDSSQATWRE